MKNTVTMSPEERNLLDMSQYNIPRRPIGWEDDDAMFDHWEKAMDMAFDKPQQRKVAIA